MLRDTDTSHQRHSFETSAEGGRYDGNDDQWDSEEEGGMVGVGRERPL